MTSMLSSRPWVSKPHDNSVKREQNPHYSHYNGLSDHCAKTDCESERTRLAPITEKFAVVDDLMALIYRNSPEFTMELGRAKRGILLSALCAATSRLRVWQKQRKTSCRP